MQTVELTGRVFSYLTVVRRDGSKGTFAAWLVRCACGTEKTLTSRELISGKTRSCGCMRAAMQREKVRKHGLTHSRTWNSWMAMRQRCERAADPSFHRYGGRGITVCARWATFTAFLEDMGERPDGASIDRIDNDGNYEPGNCRWASVGAQARNRRSSHAITCNGRTQLLVQWVAETGIRRTTIMARLRRGWTPERALSAA